MGVLLQDNPICLRPILEEMWLRRHARRRVSQQLLWAISGTLDFTKPLCGCACGCFCGWVSKPGVSQPRLDRMRLGVLVGMVRLGEMCKVSNAPHAQLESDAPHSVS